MLDWLRNLRGRAVERKLLAWHAPGRPAWPMRDPAAFAREGYGRNAIAYRCVRLIAEAAASAPLQVGPRDHPLARLLARPNPEQTGVELLEAFYGHLQVAGNAYLEAASITEDAPSELYVLRPDRMSVVPGADGWPVGWEHRVGANVRRFARDPISSDAPILHLKLFNPADARPYPAFPARRDVWSDGGAWARGHWLNGRAGLSDLGQVVRALAERAGQGVVDVSGLRGAVSGYVVDSPASARDALEPLMAAFDFSAREHDGVLTFAHADAATHALDVSMLTAVSSALTYAQRDATQAPIEARMRFIDASRDYLLAGVSARRLDRAEGGVATIDAPLVLETGAAEAIAQRLLTDRRAAIETLAISVGPAELALEAGDRVTFADEVFEIVRIEDADARRTELRRARSTSAAMLGGVEPNSPPPPLHAPTPAFAILDLPPLPRAEEDERPLAAVFASPWRGAHDIYAGPAQSARATVAAPAIMGELLWALWPGPVDRWDEGNVARVMLYGGALASATRDDVLNGANVFAIESENDWEIIQAAHCTLIEPGVYELRDFLRGRQGSAHAMRAPHPVGARIVKLDQRLARASIAAHEWGESLTFIAPPSGTAPASNRAEHADLVLPHAAIRPWAPAHLRARRDASGDVAISWARCARIGGDSWVGEPPLGFSSEGYLVEVLDFGDPIRSETTSVPSFVYTAAAQTADFGSLPGSLHIRVAQKGESGATGLNSELTITL